MGGPSVRLKHRKDCIKTLQNIYGEPKSVLIVHYSCESFYDLPTGRSPRITSIAVRHFGSGQTESFSIHKVAELQGVSLDQIENDYDHLEKLMLDEFSRCVQGHKGETWVHWNMRDTNYGFAAIDHRYRTLEGEGIEVLDGHKVDLARILVSIYGLRYAKHPRLLSVIKKNDISDRDLLSGEAEAEAFTKKEYVKLHQSTLRKVDVIANILERAAQHDLKTDAKWWDIYGFDPRALMDAMKENWILALLKLLFFLSGWGVAVLKILSTWNNIPSAKP